MTTDINFPHASFLAWLEHSDNLDAPLPAMSPTLAAMVLRDGGHGELTSAGRSLMALLVARREQQRATSSVERVADALRRYQKFAKPGAPSTHIVQLRQQQGAARQAASVAKQHVIKAAADFVRDACIAVPPRVALELFVTRWILANIPQE